MSDKEATLSEEAPQALADAISDIQELMRHKEELEAQGKAYYDMLEGQREVEMDELGWTARATPAHVDLYQVCTVRHIICLQNDHKAVMKQVEEALHQLHAHDKEKQARNMAEAQQEAMSHKLGYPESHSPSEAFARVNSISPGSPPSTAVLQIDGEILEFGSVSTQNLQSLHHISSVVQHSEMKLSLAVTVLHQGQRHQLRLGPKRWAGRPAGLQHCPSADMTVLGAAGQPLPCPGLGSNVDVFIFSPGV